MKTTTTTAQTELERQLLECHKEVRFWSKVFIVAILALGTLSIYLASDSRILAELLR